MLQECTVVNEIGGFGHGFHRYFQKAPDRAQVFQ